MGHGDDYEDENGYGHEEAMGLEMVLEEVEEDDGDGDDDNELDDDEDQLPLHKVEQMLCTVPKQLLREMGLP